MNVPWWNVNLGPAAERAVAEAVANRRVSMGVLARELEGRLGEILGVPHVVAVPSGTMALTLALIEAGVGAGDEVIVPECTWVATANAPYLLGAKVVLVDVEADAPYISPDAVAAAITPRTKAVLPVHLNGRGCNLPAIREIAARHGVTVIEDAAQGIFARSAEGGYLGTHSHSGCFSLAMTKPITCGQGGFVVTRDAPTAARLRRIRNQGTDNIEDAHWLGVGGNFRFTDVLAAIALSQLDRLGERLDALQRVYAFYARHIHPTPQLTLVPHAPERGEVPLYPEVRCTARESLCAFLAARGIQVRPFYPPLRSAPHLAQPGAFPHAEMWAGQLLMLPCGPDRREEELQQVVDAVNAWAAGSAQEAPWTR